MKKLSPEASRIVVDRLGTTVDLLHREADLGRDRYGLTNEEAHREAADWIAAVRKEVRES